MTWLDVDGGYALTIDLDDPAHPRIRARNARGRVLASVPAKLRKTDQHAQLEGVVDQLGTHRRRVRADVEQWMLDGLPVPVVQLVAVWPDRYWAEALTDLVVEVGDSRGLLRGVADDRLGLVTLDGETEWATADTARILHPVLLADELADYRELAAELGVTQQIDQLMRRTWQREADRKPEATSVDDFRGGRYAVLTHAYGRAAAGGYPVRGGYAVRRIWEDGHQYEARLWVGTEYFQSETELGELLWIDETTHRVLPLCEVPPVAWSEGMRLGNHLWAGRNPELDR